MKKDLEEMGIQGSEMNNREAYGSRIRNTKCSGKEAIQSATDLKSAKLFYQTTKNPTRAFIRQLDPGLKHSGQKRGRIC